MLKNIAKNILNKSDDVIRKGTKTALKKGDDVIKKGAQKATEASSKKAASKVKAVSSKVKGKTLNKAKKSGKVVKGKKNLKKSNVKRMKGTDYNKKYSNAKSKIAQKAVEDAKISKGKLAALGAGSMAGSAIGGRGAAESGYKVGQADTNGDKRISKKELAAYKMKKKKKR